MGRFVGYVGVVNHLGGKFTADARALTPALGEIAARGLFYLDDGSSPRSLAREVAPTLGLASAAADAVVDADAAPAAIDAALTRLEALARARGAAIGVATALPSSLDRIARWSAGLEARGVELVPVSALTAAGARPGGGGRHAEPTRVRSVRDARVCPIAAAPASRWSIAPARSFIGRRARSREATLVAGHEWQMPQGGIDDGEEPYAGALRELYEETSVSSVSLIAEAPDWLSYDLPEESGNRWRGRYRGQTQKWFLLRFEGEEAEIDIRHPGRRRPQAGVRRLALGTIRTPARTGRAVQARRLRKGRRAVRAAGQAGVRLWAGDKTFSTGKPCQALRRQNARADSNNT